MKQIKNKFPFFLLIIFLVSGMFLTGTNQAKAVGNAFFPQDTTVTLSIGSFNIVGGSDADTVTISTADNTITVAISTGQSFTLESTGRNKLNNDSSYLFTCTDTKSSITLTTTVTTTVVITPSSTTCGSSSGGGSVSTPTPTPVSGGGGGGGTTTSTSTPTPTPSPVSTPTPTPTTTPALTTTPSPVSVGITPSLRGFTNLTVLKLKEGDVISAAGSSDPDVYIVNAWGYKRLFLNPVIFKFYGHLGGFSKVKTTVASTRDTLVTSGLFRNCETNDKKVYGVETTGEDTGMLHWVNTTGAQAVVDDPDFFKKVFCINSNEFNWYKQGASYTSVNQIPAYTRTSSTSTSGSPVSVVLKKVKVVSTVPWVNVRDKGSLSGKVIAQVLPGETYEFVTKNSDGWYNIKKGGVVWGWVIGQYVKEL